MITKEKIEIYNHFNGDSDGFERMGTHEQKLLMENNDWSKIEGFIQDIQLVKKGIASDSYFKNVKEKMVVECDIESIIEIEKFAQNRPSH